RVAPRARGTQAASRCWIRNRRRRSSIGLVDCPLVDCHRGVVDGLRQGRVRMADAGQDRKSTRLNSSHVKISYAVFCLKKNILPFSGDIENSYSFTLVMYYSILLYLQGMIWITRLYLLDFLDLFYLYC